MTPSDSTDSEESTDTAVESSVDRPAASSARREVLRGLAILVGLGAGGIYWFYEVMGGESTDSPPSSSMTDDAANDVVEEQAVTLSDIRPRDVCRSNVEIEDSGALTLDSNTRGRFRCAGQPLDAFEDLSVWTASDGSMAADTETFDEGSQSMVLEARPDDEWLLVHRSFENGLDFSSVDLSLSVKLDTPDWRGVLVDLYAPDENNVVRMETSVSRIDGWNRIDLAPTERFGNPDLHEVQRIEIGSYVGDNADVRFWIDALRTTPKADNGAVLFTFDDNLASQYNHAFPILHEFGYPATVGVIPNAVGLDETDNHHMTMQQLDDLSSSGWEMVCHPQKDQPLAKLSRSVQREAMRSTKRWLADHGFERGANHVIWPYGWYEADTLDIASEYFHLGFGGGSAPSGEVLTGPLTMSRIDGERVAPSKQLVDMAAAYDCTTVLMFHHVGTTDGISTADFESLVEHVHHADVDVLVASDVFDRMQSSIAR